MDAEREQAAGVFAALEDAGLWVDSAAQPLLAACSVLCRPLKRMVYGSEENS